MRLTNPPCLVYHKHEHTERTNTVKNLLQGTEFISMIFAAAGGVGLIAVMAAAIAGSGFAVTLALVMTLLAFVGMTITAIGSNL